MQRKDKDSEVDIALFPQISKAQSNMLIYCGISVYYCLYSLGYFSTQFWEKLHVSH